MYGIPLVNLLLAHPIALAQLIAFLLALLLVADTLYASVGDHWLRYSAERAASIGMLLVLATIAVICKHRAYRMLLGGALIAANLALILAIISRWLRPASRAWGLFSCCAITVTTTIVLAGMSVHGSFTVNE